MKEKSKLYFKGGFLRTLEKNDITKKYLTGINDPEVNKYLVSVKSKKQTQQLLERFAIENMESSSSIVFGIWLTEAEELSGTVRLHDIEYIFGTANIGICIFDRKAWGKGIGSQAILSVTNWGFDKLDLRWIEAGMYDQNTSSRKCFLNAGYEWITDIPGKYLLDGEPATINILAAKKSQ